MNEKRLFFPLLFALLLAARLCHYSQTFLAGQTHEYGTTLLVLAGLFNLLALAGALELRKAKRA